jgi:hypothetical protein
MNNDINTSIKKINKLYDHLTYFDLYGNSVLFFIIITLIVFLVYSYSVVMVNSNAIKADWVNQRCNPKVIPFAGFINKPDDQGIFDYTGDNFSFCIQDILTKITGYAVQPFDFIINFLSAIFDDIKNAVNIIREFLASIRTKFSEIAENILTRILNMLIPIQRIFIALRDSFAKSQAVLTAGLYTSLGAYYTLQSLLGAIAELIIEILIAMAIICVALWICPFTMGMAATLTAVFISISIPLTIITVFMVDVLNVQTEGIPPVPNCLDKNTLIQMNDLTYKKIIDIKLGDILLNNNKVTSIIKVNAKGSDMYNLNGIIVSGTHILKYNNKWIKVSEHPFSKLIEVYDESYLYCLNTSSKIIIINDLIFTDWDEIYENNLEKILNLKINDVIIKYPENIHYYLDNGFNKDTLIDLMDGTKKSIQNIKIGDIIAGNHKVYGLVKIDANNLYINNYLGIESEKENYLYHLLTYTKNISIDSVIYSDYNSLIDINLNN